MSTATDRVEMFRKIVGLVVMVLAVSLLHYGTQTDRPLLHDIYRRLYYLPVGLSAVWFGLRGGLAVAVAVAGVYAPHIAMHWGGESREVVNRVLEVGVFFLFAGVTGYFSDRERRFRLRWQGAAERLERLYKQLRGQADEILEIESQLRRADRLSAVGELAAGMTHEIRNPLGSIKGAAEILRDEATHPNARKEFLEILLQETERLDKVVKDFLGYARDRRAETDTEVSALSDLVENTLSLVESHARKAGVSVSAQIQPGMQVRGVPHQLKQVLLNLLLNAIQATPADREIRVVGRASGREGPRNNLVLAVEDEGTGIETPELERVFEPFFTTKQEGTGLGLAISQRIAQAHGGTLRAERRQGGGTRFVLELPLFDHPEGQSVNEE